MTQKAEVISVNRAFARFKKRKYQIVSKLRNIAKKKEFGIPVFRQNRS